MQHKNLDELLDTLEWIAFYKSMLPFRLRGWVAALGLHVQIREAGGWTRLQAGGSFRSYLDAWREGEGAWEIRKFDRQTWERRFAHVVEHTLDIVAFLDARDLSYGGLDGEQAAILNEAITHYKSTGIWLGLPPVPEQVQEAHLRREQEQERQKRLERLRKDISRYEAQTRKAPGEPAPWSLLAHMYLEAADMFSEVGRYKDVEHALNMSAKATQARFPDTEWASWAQHQYLGRLYLAALSNSRRGRGIPIRGYIPSKVTPESLGYTAEEVRSLAEENSRKAHAGAKGAGFTEDSPDMKEIELAIEASVSPSERAFEEYEKFIARAS